MGLKEEQWSSRTEEEEEQASNGENAGEDDSDQENQGEEAESERSTVRDDLKSKEEIDWANFPKDIDALREVLGYEDGDIPKAFDDALVRTTWKAISWDQKVGNGDGATVDIDTLRDQVAVAADIWENRTERRTVGYDGTPESLEVVNERIKEINGRLNEIRRSGNVPELETTWYVLDRLSADWDRSLRDSEMRGDEHPTLTNLERMRMLDGYAMRYDAMMDAAEASGREAETDSGEAKYEGNLSSFEKVLDIKDGELSDAEADAMSRAWNQELLDAQEAGPSQYAAKKQEIRQEIEAINSWYERDPEADGPDRYETAQDIKAAQQRLRALERILQDGWDPPEGGARFGEGQRTLERLLDGAEARLATGEMAINDGGKMSEVSETWLAGAMLTLEHAADKYREAAQNSGKSGSSRPEDDGRQGAPESDPQTEKPSSDTESGNNAARGEEQASGQSTAGDERTARDGRGTAESDEGTAGPGNRRGWEAHQTEMYYDLMVRNKNVADTFRKGETLSVSDTRLPWNLMMSKQERHVTTVAAALGDRSRWMTSEERAERAMAATEQMLSSESFKQEERAGERAYSSWVPNRPENMSKAELWEIMDDKDKNYFTSVAQQVAKNLEMAADPDVRWSNKDAAKAIRNIMKAAAEYAVGEGIVDRNGWLLRVPRQAADGGVKTGAGGANGDGATTTATGGGQNNGADEQERQRRNDAETGRPDSQGGDAETGGRQASEREKKPKAERWDLATLQDKLKDRTPAEGTEYIRALINDEMGAGRQSGGRQALFADAMAERYQDDLYNQAAEGNQDEFAEAVANLKADAAGLKGLKWTGGDIEVTRENSATFEQGAPAMQVYEDRLENAGESAVTDTQRRLLDELYEMARLTDGKDDTNQKMERYLDGVQTLDAQMARDERTREAATTIVADTKVKDHALLDTTIDEPTFMSAVMGQKGDESEERLELNRAAWEAYRPIIEHAQKERSGDLLLGAIKQGRRDAEMFSRLDLDGANWDKRDFTNYGETEIKGFEAQLSAGAAGQMERDELKPGLDQGITDRAGSVVMAAIWDDLKTAAEHGREIADTKVSDTMRTRLSLLERLTSTQEQKVPA